MKAQFAAIIIAAATASPVDAQQNCAPHEVVSDSLSRKYGEEFIRDRAGEDGAIIEFWANGETGTWSLLVAGPDGITCMVRNGGGWRSEMAEADNAKDSDA